MRLAGGIFNNRAPLSKHCRDHDIHRSADGDLVKIYSRAVELTVGSIRNDEAVFNVNIRTKRGHTFYMLINRPHAKVAASGHSRLGAAEAPEHRANKVIGSADLAHQIIWSVIIGNIAAIHLYGRFIYKANLRAKVSENGQKHIGIADLGNIFNTANALDQKRGRDYRNSGIFRTAYLNFTVKGYSAVNNIFIQKKHLPSYWQSRTPYQSLILS